MLNSVVISGPPAIGKTTVAKGIALEFNLTHLSGGDILKDLASEQGFSTGGDDWWDTEEGMQFLNQRKSNPEFDKNVDSRLKELFQNGGVVITSYTLPWIIDNGIKIWLAGNIENSAKRMQTRDNVTQLHALDVVKKRFNENKLIYKSLYNFEFGENLSVFDAVIETDSLNVQQVLDKAKSIVRKLL